MEQHVQNQQQHTAEHQPTSNTNISGSNNNLANNKKNSPMCLINNLAQYNKIEYQYLRSEEQGPAHNKLYTVTLKLGNEEYQAEDTRIKKAQHSAAAMALQHTQFKHPPPKVNRNNKSRRVTPTVELNVLAMKRRERVVYVLDDKVSALQAQGYMWQPCQYNVYGLGQSSYNYEPGYNNYAKNYTACYQSCYNGQNRYHHLPGKLFSVCLYVGERKYSGMGYTMQAARHDAASKAIEDIKQKEMDDNQQYPFVASSPTEIFSELNTKLKSPIPLVHKIASKKNLNVIFEVLSEKGPCHKKVFVTQCRLGDLMTKGEGNSKAISKRLAAEKMLKELKKLGPLPNTTNLVKKKRKRVVNRKKRKSVVNRKKRKSVVNNKKQHNLIQVNSNQNSNYIEEIDPVCHLTQNQQANKEKEPLYHVSERGAQRRRRASVNGDISTDVGPIKKIPKRNDAEAFLGLLGYPNSPAPQNTPKPVIEVEKKTEQVKKPQKITFMKERQESAVGDAEGQQLVAGLLLVDEHFGVFQQPKAILGRSEMLNSGSVSAPTDQVGKKSIQVTQTVQPKDQFKMKMDDNVSANKESNAESACGGITAEPQVVPKAKPN